MAKRPSVEKRCPADRYAGPGERIIEVSWPDGRGCLVSFRTVNGAPVVEVYRADDGVSVRAISEKKE